MQFPISQSDDDAGCPVSCSNNTDPLSSSRCTKGNPLSALGVCLLAAPPPKVSIVRISNFSLGTRSSSGMKKNVGQTLRGNMFCFWVSKSYLKKKAKPGEMVAGLIAGSSYSESNMTIS